MNKLLVHIITGVENPSRAVLGFLVAKSAIEDGNDVTIFCAGDGVTSLHEITTKEMQGVGLGTLSEHLEVLKSNGAHLYASGKSAPVLLPRYRVQDIDTPEDWEQAELMMEVLRNSQEHG